MKTKTVESLLSSEPYVSSDWAKNSDEESDTKHSPEATWGGEKLDSHEIDDKS
jgi:hypothetical protein